MRQPLGRLLRLLMEVGTILHRWLPWNIPRLGRQSLRHVTEEMLLPVPALRVVLLSHHQQCNLPCQVTQPQQTFNYSHPGYSLGEGERGTLSRPEAVNRRSPSPVPPWSTPACPMPPPDPGPSAPQTKHSPAYQSVQKPRQILPVKPLSAAQSLHPL